MKVKERDYFQDMHKRRDLSQSHLRWHAKCQSFCDHSSSSLLKDLPPKATVRCLRRAGFLRPEGKWKATK